MIFYLRELSIRTNSNVVRIVNIFRKRRHTFCKQTCFSRKLCTGNIRNSKLVLGIETSCDDTGAAVVNDEGLILGEALHSQVKTSVEYGHYYLFLILK